jgi:hypothetical protein
MALYTPEVGHVGHYSSTASLISILRSTELWFADLECLADRSGKTYPADLYRVIADEMLSSPAPDPNGYRVLFAQSVKRKARPFQDEQYVCRFSKKIDSYHHWLGFSHATPVCIIFRAADIATAVQTATGQTPPHRFFAGDVDYAGEPVIRQEVTVLLNQFLASTQNIPPGAHGNPLYNLENLTDNVALNLQKAENAKYVSPVFSQDEEYRILLRKPSNNATSWDRPVDEAGAYFTFVPKPSFVRPTVVAHLGADFKNLICGVVVGPGPETDIAVKKAGMLLNSMGYRWQGNPVPVYQSAVPYRWW